MKKILKRKFLKLRSSVCGKEFYYDLTKMRDLKFIIRGTFWYYAYSARYRLLKILKIKDSWAN